MRSDSGTDILNSLKTQKQMGMISKQKLSSIPQNIEFIKNVAHCKSGKDPYFSSYYIIDIISSNKDYYFRCISAQMSDGPNGRPVFMACESFCSLKLPLSEVCKHNLGINVVSANSVLDLFKAANLRDSYDFGEFLENDICWKSSYETMPAEIMSSYYRRFYF